MSVQDKKAFARTHSPEAHRMIIAATRQPLAIRAKRHRTYPIIVLLQRSHARSRMHVPDTYRAVVIVLARQQPSIGAEGQRVAPGAVSLQRSQTLAGLHLPEPDSSIITATRQQGPIGAEGN